MEPIELFLLIFAMSAFILIIPRGAKLLIDTIKNRY